MCSAGGPPDYDLEMGDIKEYKCKDCGGEFKGIGKNPGCPMCASDRVEKVR